MCKTSEFCQVFLVKLPQINDAQAAMLILRYCGIPNISHLLQSVSPLVIADAAREFDIAIKETFEAIIGCKLSRQQKQQLSLRFGQGGFMAAPAYLGAWASSLFLSSPKTITIS